MSARMRTASYWLSGVLLSLAAALILEGIFAIPLVFSWFASINVLALIFYAIDKLNSIWEDQSEQHKAMQVRIPEVSLLLLALFGGSLGAGLAIGVLDHKLSKNWFMIRFALILILQMAVVGLLLWDSVPLP
jgi:uncharacterized membrane protein YsdA (DUF1294 family)